MDIKKIFLGAIIFIILLAVATAAISQIKPQMHKTFMFEQIIFKRAK